MKTLCCFLLLGFISAPACAQTASGGNARLGWYASETVLTPTNVASGLFARQAAFAVTGAVYAQPLYVPGSPNTLIVATMTNDVYEFNADQPGSAAIWHTNLGAPRTSFPNVSGQLFYNAQVGCLATPVVDAPNNAIYALCATPVPAWVLYKLNLATGATTASVVVTGAYPGTGDPCTGFVGACAGADTTSGSNVVFYPEYQLGRTALTLTPAGNIYIGFGSFADYTPYHGWIMGYNSELTQIGVFCTTPSGEGGGMNWGGGFAVDSSGDIIAISGNGNYDGVTEFGLSVFKFSSTLSMLDWWTPPNYAALNVNDSDLSSSRPMLIPGTTLVAFGSKDYFVHSVDTSCMGHTGGTVGGCAAAQTIATGTPVITTHSGIYGDLFMNGVGYFPVTTDSVYRSSLTGTTWASTTASAATYAYPGGTMSGSSNGAANAIVWAVTSAVDAETSPETGVLNALNATTMAPIWSSSGRSSDAMGQLTKFQVPVVANGQVFVGTYNNGVVVYGVSPTGTFTGGSLTMGGNLAQN